MKELGVAVLLIDVINAFDFEGSEGLTLAAERAAPQIRRLAERARRSQIPIIYVNDNFGQWRSDFRATIEGCTAQSVPGRRVSEQLRPEPEDYFVLKPQHSGFFSTTLSLLLDYLNVHTLVLGGFATNICVLFTANDAHMHGFNLYVPKDCTASNTEMLTEAALEHVRCALGACTDPADQIDFSALAKGGRKQRGQTF